MKSLIKSVFLAISSLLAVGCASTQTPSVISVTGTVIGVEIAQNPASQIPQAKLGYNRAEFAWVPLSPQWDVPNVLHELNYGSIFDWNNASIYQRMAVGDKAVSQPGAWLLFAKGMDGVLDPQVAGEITQALKEVPAPTPSATASKLSLGKQYTSSQDKEAFDAVAREFGYENFQSYLAEAQTPIQKQIDLKGRLIEKGLVR